MEYRAQQSFIIAKKIGILEKNGKIDVWTVKEFQSTFLVYYQYIEEVKKVFVDIGIIPIIEVVDIPAFLKVNLN